MHSLTNRLILDLRALPVPIVAAVNGAAAGAGVGLALAADVVLAARSSYFLKEMLSSTRIAYTRRPLRSPLGAYLEPKPATQSFFWATRRIPGLQIASVHIPLNGFGAAPSSIGIV